MRTLKKALSLVLVLAMVFTLAVPALAVDKASEFKDYAKVQNKEAVDVLTAIGVINGNADGTFGADAKFTRAQGATMIAYLTLGKTVADALPASATEFSDVPANFWGAKYIQYCADEGIINGYGNGKFGPDDTLTSAQWALMLLGALGYSSKNEGIGGTGWEIAATRLAMKAGVASADDMVGTMTRDTAAKMAFNTLKADLVEYQSNGTNITVGDTNINVGATKAEPVTSKADYAKNFGDAATTVGGDTYVVQFGEEHFSKLTLETTGKLDDFGRPATEWKLGTKLIAVGAKAPTHTFVATKTYDVNSQEKFLNALNKALDITANSSKLVGTQAQNEVVNGTAVNGWANATLKAGDVVEVYTDSKDATKVTTTVVTRYSAVKVEAVRDLTASQIKNNASSADEDVVNATQRISLSDGSTIYNTKFAGFDYAVGDNVLVAKKGPDKVLASKATETVTGVVTKVTGLTVVVDGETYTLANGATAVAKKGDQTFVVADGFIWGASETVSKDYVVVVAKSTNPQGDAGFESRYINVRYVDKNGEVVTTKVAEDKAKNVYLNNWYTVSDDPDNAGMKVFATQTGFDYTENSISVLNKTAPTFESTVNPGRKTVADSKTVFVLKTGANTYKSYTGIENVPGYKFDTTKASAYYIKNIAGVAEVVYIDVTVGGASDVASKDVIYVLDEDAVGTGYDATNNVNYDIYNAIVDGEKTTVGVHKGAAIDSGLVTVDSYDANGYIAKATECVDDPYAKLPVSSKTVSYSSPVLTIDGTSYLLASDVAVYMIDTNDNVSTAGAADLVGTANGTVYLVYKSTTDHTVTAVYFDGTVTF